MPIHDNIQSVVDKVEQRTISIEALERFDFYAAAGRPTPSPERPTPGPYDRFLLRKGVI